MVDHDGEPTASRAGGQDGPEDSVSGGERVAKALARAGVASRREVERLIADGRVTLDGVRLTTPAIKVSPGQALAVDGRPVAAAEPTRVWRYHKPSGLVTTHADPQNRPTVFQALPQGMPRVISVGRLDLATEGLLLLTNDGELASALELPSTGWVRRYRARAYGRVTQADLDRLKGGITVEGVAYGPIEARLDKAKRKPGDPEGSPANCWISVAVAEGKNREVRRVLEALGLRVNRLIRLAYGPFALATLPIGAVEEVGPRVIREQLSGLISPANLPTGERARQPAFAAAPSGQRRAALVPVGDGGVAKAKKTYKPGWARPKPKAGPPPSRKGGKARVAPSGPAPGDVLHARPEKTASPKARPSSSRSSAGGSPRGGGGGRRGPRQA